MTEIQSMCFRDWMKSKECELYSTNFEETFLRLAGDLTSYTRAFVAGWEMGRGQVTGLLK